MFKKAMKKIKNFANGNSMSVLSFLLVNAISVTAAVVAGNFISTNILK